MLAQLNKSSVENKTLPKAQRIQGLSSFTFVSVSVLVGALTLLVWYAPHCQCQVPFQIWIVQNYIMWIGSLFSAQWSFSIILFRFKASKWMSPTNSLMMQFLFKTWCRMYKIGWKLSSFKPRFDEDSIFGFRLPLNLLPWILALIFNPWKLGEGVFVSLLC